MLRHNYKGILLFIKCFSGSFYFFYFLEMGLWESVWKIVWRTLPTWAAPLILETTISIIYSTET